MTKKNVYNILLLCNLPDNGADANTIQDHIKAFAAFSKHKIWMYSNIGKISLKLDLSNFDAIIIHYSICLLNNYYLSEDSKARIRAFNGLKMVFVQDEYRQINSMIAQLQYLKIDVLFTCFGETEIEKIYPKDALPGVSKYNNLTGYVPTALCRSVFHQPMTKRPIHVGYRARQLPFWYGELAYEKWDIVNQWKSNVNDAEIVTDISYHEQDRLYGENWIRFLTTCKTTLGVESGASVMDFTGEIERKVTAHQMLYPKDSFKSVQKRYLQPYEQRYKLNQISPRCFEAIALKTVLVLYEGEYSKILIPNRHYIVLKKDFSNISEVVEKIKNDDFLQQMSDVAYNEIALNANYRYESFIQRVDHIIQTEFENRNKLAAHCIYDESLFRKAINSVDLRSKIERELRKLFKRLPPYIQMVVRNIVRPRQAFKLLFMRLPLSIKEKILLRR